MNNLLYSLMQSGDLSPLAYFFARFIGEKSAQSEDSLLVASAALVSERNQQGDVCVNLRQYAGQALFESGQISAGEVVQGPEIGEWLEQLASDQCVGKPGDVAPLVLEDGRLYLGKFWNYENCVVDAIRSRLEPGATYDEEILRTGLRRLYPDANNRDTPDWQKIASAIALTQRFSIISGGPGTGKTTAIVKVLALLLEQNPDMRIRLAAPTGKAAARMTESIRSRKSEIDLDESVRVLIPDQAATIHRLLGYQGSHFRFDQQNKLVVDCLVIDEASMIDLTLMHRIFAAMPEHARIILLGDRDQLASVDAGNVLGDITGHGQDIGYSTSMVETLNELTGVSKDRLALNRQAPVISNAIGLLKTSFRFDEKSGIAKLSRLVNAGKGEAALDVLRDDNDQTELLLADVRSVAQAMIDWASDRYTLFLQCDDVAAAVDAFEKTRILCAVHQGPFGNELLNRLITEQLVKRQLIESGEDYQGKPVLITRNDYEVELYNGDIGILWKDEHGDLRAWFKLSDGNMRAIPLHSLPEHVTAWAMTVHKSQGSEFEQVMLVLPDDENSPVLSRELIYTGVTRASRKVIVHSSTASFIRGCEKHVQRNSGLAEKLGW